MATKVAELSPSLSKAYGCLGSSGPPSLLPSLPPSRPLWFLPSFGFLKSSLSPSVPPSRPLGPPPHPPSLHAREASGPESLHQSLTNPVNL